MIDPMIYRHSVQYYETDAMGIVHHSNYIRWMEETRSDFLLQSGTSIREIEDLGLLMPVLEVSCKYQTPATFGDTVKIRAQLDWFNGLKYQVSYFMTNEDERITYVTGTSLHCFLNKKLRPVVLERVAPEIFQIFYEQALEKRRPLK